MIQNIYCVEDVQASWYKGVFLEADDKHAKWIFGDCVCDSRSLFNQFPFDFHLVRIGTFDDDTGLIVPLEKPEYICRASDVIRKDGREELPY